MFDLKEIFKALRLPLGLVAVIVALLAWVGLTIDQLVTVATSLIGLQLVLSVLIDVLKYVGVVNAGSAGKWSAAFNLVTLIGVAVYLKLFPGIDIYAVDNQLLELGKVLVIVFTYITQIIGTKAFHASTRMMGMGATASG
jgi:hypothetical protein